MDHTLCQALSFLYIDCPFLQGPHVEDSITPNLQLRNWDLGECWARVPKITQVIAWAGMCAQRFWILSLDSQEKWESPPS